MSCEDPNVVLLSAAIDERIGSGNYDPAAGWQHVGAVITDAVLQSSLRRSTVKTRVEALVEAWPDADTLTGFRKHINEDGLDKALDSNESKLKTIAAVASRLGGEDVDYHRLDSMDDVSKWLADPVHVKSLHSIKGVNDKTTNYLCALSGLSSDAMDLHLREFIKEANVTLDKTDEIKALFDKTAECRGVHPGGLAYAVWHYRSALIKAR